jgi:TPP-dependent pyruvate/acetoin dehydrogenase alpha subunit
MTTTTIEQAAAQLAGHQGFSIISDEKLRQLYLSMVKGRLLAERLRSFGGQDGRDAGAGHEAAAVGVLAGLLPEDAVGTAPGNLIVRFLRNEIQGKPLEELLAHDAEPDFAGQLKLTLRAAQASKAAGKGKIAVVFSDGDSGFSEKALKRANAKRLPVLFIRPTSVLSETSRAQVCGVPVIPVDGGDVVAVYRVATESITHARKGNGPTLMECVFDPTEAHDRIVKMEAYLTRKGLFREAWKREELAKFTRRLDAAIHAAKA